MPNRGGENYTDEKIYIHTPTNPKIKPTKQTHLIIYKQQKNPPQKKVKLVNQAIKLSAITNLQANI